ncbi:MAG: CHAD domain-containing protein [Flavobacteriales bacterium]
MSHAHQRFMHYLGQLKELLTTTSGKRNNKGRTFYKAGARNVVFRLEALCRLYRGIGDKKLFDSWYKEFKALEDTLGSVDHHEAMLTEFCAYKPLKRHAEKMLGAQLEDEVAFLEAVLRDGDWLGGHKLAAFEHDLQQADWNEAQLDSKDFSQGMLYELEKLEEKYCSGEIDLSLLEAGVHEFRRRLRWVSIYAASANGMVQLRQSKTFAAELEKYQSPAVVNSPFNKMQRAQRGQKIIYIQSSYFYALSWLIDHLGELKDIGIRSENFHALCDAASITDKNLEAQFIATCRFHPKEICAQAEIAVDQFILNDRIMTKLQRDLKRHTAAFE